jgi:hypothetical protein
MTSNQDLRIRIQESKAWRLVIYVLFTLGFTFFLGIFEVIFGSWLHELGHALTTWSVGATVIKIEWGRTCIETTYPWQRTIINFGGGLFAAFFLFLVYLLLTKKGKSIDTHKHILRDAVLSLRVILLAGTIDELADGILEGGFQAIYRASDPSLIFLVAFLSVSASFIIIMRKTKEHASEPHTSTPKEPTTTQQQSSCEESDSQSMQNTKTLETRRLNPLFWQR